MMAFPGTVDTVTVTLGPVLTAGGNPLTGAVFKAELPVQVRVTDSGFVLPTTAVAKTGTDGIATLVLVATDSTGIDVTGFTYTITAPSWSSTSQAVALPAASPSVRVEDLVSVTASDGSTIWTPAALTDAVVAALVTDTGSATYTAVSALAGGGASTLGDLTDVSETGADAGEALVSDGVGSWAPSAAAVILEGDGRLTDARTPSAHTHTVSEVTDAGGAASLEVGTGVGTVAAGDHTHAGVYDPAGTAASAVSTHEAGTGVHTIAGTTGLQSALDGKSATGHTHTLAGVTDSGTAAALNVPATGDAAAGEVVKGDDTRLTDARTPASHTHTVSDVTDAGGAASLNVGTTTGTVAAGDDSRITGAAQKASNLSDLASASTARTNLGLGTAATTAATDYAVASGQGAVNTVATSGATETIPVTHAWHDITMDQDCVFTFSSPTAAHTFALVLRGAFTPTFPASVDWGDATAPTYSTPSVYVFTSVDAGTTWLGTQGGKAFA